MRRIRRIHFVGAGGIGMSGLAELLSIQGYEVSGSDLRDGAGVQRLRSLGIDVTVGHDESNVGEADVVVYSSAIRPTNPELREAEQRKVPVIPRAEMLAEVMRLKDGIAVAGSHGKTTTTSLIAHVLDAAGLDPTVIVGGRVQAAGRAPTTTRVGQSELLVAEADESDGSFLRLAPVIAVVTNIDPEHMDYYADYDTLREAFATFVNGVPFWGASVLCLDHPGVQSIMPLTRRRTITYGTVSQADLMAEDLQSDGHGTRFRMRYRGEVLGSARSPLPGHHNVQNTVATLAVALELDVDFRVAADALDSFVGIERRFQRIGEARGIQVVDDYGHHPAEIVATLEAARQLHDGRIVVAFQPHRYTRTQTLWEDFTRAFNDADVLVLTEIYAASESKIPGIDSATLAQAVRSHGHREVMHVSDLDAVLDTLVDITREGDLVITLGAGNISSLAARLVERLQEGV
jgi:UDP-N-acetylmuramate--alanine ligase